jgi:hypothetical protein
MNSNPLLALVTNPKGELVATLPSKAEALAVGKKMASAGCRVAGKPKGGSWQLSVNPLGRSPAEIARLLKFAMASNPGRPTREFMKRCTKGVGKGYDPGAVCAATWHKMSPAQKRKWLARENPRSHYRSGAEIGLKATGCDGCSPSMVNGHLVHESGCPFAWRDRQVKCFECGCGFYPEERHQRICPDCLPRENPGYDQGLGMAGEGNRLARIRMAAEVARKKGERVFVAWNQGTESWDILEHPPLLGRFWEVPPGQPERAVRHNPDASYHKAAMVEEKRLRDLDLDMADNARRFGMTERASELQGSAERHDIRATNQFEDMMNTAKLAAAKKVGMSPEQALRANPGHRRRHHGLTAAERKRFASMDPQTVAFIFAMSSIEEARQWQERLKAHMGMSPEQALRANPKRRHQVEVLPARKYYGRHAAGWVCLIDGHVYLHGDKTDCERMAEKARAWRGNPGPEYHSEGYRREMAEARQAFRSGERQVGYVHLGAAGAHAASGRELRTRELGLSENPGGAPRLWVVINTHNGNTYDQVEADNIHQAITMFRTSGWEDEFDDPDSEFDVIELGALRARGNPGAAYHARKAKWFKREQLKRIQGKSWPTGYIGAAELDSAVMAHRQSVQASKRLGLKNPGVDPVSSAHPGGRLTHGGQYHPALEYRPGRSGKCPKCGDVIYDKGLCFRCLHPEIKRPNGSVRSSPASRIAQARRALIAKGVLSPKMPLYLYRQVRIEVTDQGDAFVHFPASAYPQIFRRLIGPEPRSLPSGAPPYSRASRRNPSSAELAQIQQIKGVEPWMVSNPKFIAALKKYIEFHGCWPTSISKRDIKGLGQAQDKDFFVNMGKALDVSYEPTAAQKGSNKYGSAWLHEFNEGGNPKDKAALPDRLCSSDGKTIITHGGKFAVKDWVRK